jgi:hypothetical protein
MKVLGRVLHVCILGLCLIALVGCCPPFCWPPTPDRKARLSPPTVGAPLYECATAVTISGFVPGATLTIYANGTTKVGGGVSDAPWGQSFAVNPPLVASQNITATQTYGSVMSAPSVGVQVVNYFEQHPEGLTKPVLEAPIYDCGGAISVRNLVEGGLLEVYANSNRVGVADGCGPGQWVFATPQFVKGQGVYATETLCAKKSPKSDVKMVIDAPSSLPTPVVEQVFEGGKYGVVKNITNGAKVTVFNGAVQIGGHYCPGGSQRMRFNPAPAAGDVLTANQTLCNVASNPSDPVVVKPCGELPAPGILPVCAGATAVTVRDASPDARIRVYADGVLVGDGGGSPINLFSAAATGQKITATQSLGTCTSPPSAPVEVKKGAEPPYEPAYWNNPSIVRCNNCYNYGTNIRTDTFAQPGYAHGVGHSLTCPTVGSAAKADGLIDHNKEKVCGGCTHLVALVMDPGSDYHWYRRDDNGMWSHKPGGTPATNVDASGNPIGNPETANRNYGGADYGLNYEEFCGYYCVDKNNVTIDGWRSCD